MAKYCRENGCNTLIDSGAYCDEHKKRKKVRPSYSSNKAFYMSKPWIDLRAFVYQRDGMCCVNCGKFVMGKDAQVDHVLPIWLEPDLKLYPENCRLLCAKCHPILEYKPPGRKNKNNYSWR